MGESVLDRALKAMRHAGLEATQPAIAKLLKIKQPSVNEWRTGNMSVGRARLLAEKTGVSANWLMTGRGDMLPPVEMPQDLRELAEMWPALTNEDKGRILDVAKGCFTYRQSTAFTGDPERHTAVHEQIEQYQAKNHKNPSKKPTGRRKANPKK